jgi:hypothetical protein
MYNHAPHLVLGFHGCDRRFGEQVLSGKKNLHFSRNQYDWLGSGIYFWEDDENRAAEFALKFQE